MGNRPLFQHVIRLMAILVFSFLILSPDADANTYPPTTTSHFLGDANGDTVVSGLDGFANNDWDVGFISLKAVGPAGSSSPVKIAYSSHTLIIAYRTQNTPYTSSDDLAVMLPNSTNGPDWCELTPMGGCMPGQYNAERAWVCVQ